MWSTSNPFSMENIYFCHRCAEANLAGQTNPETVPSGFTDFRAFNYSKRKTPRLVLYPGPISHHQSTRHSDEDIEMLGCTPILFSALPALLTPPLTMSLSMPPGSLLPSVLATQSPSLERGSPPLTPPPTTSITTPPGSPLPQALATLSPDLCEAQHR